MYCFTQDSDDAPTISNINIDAFIRSRYTMYGNATDRYSVHLPVDLLISKLILSWDDLLFILQ